MLPQKKDKKLTEDMRMAIAASTDLTAQLVLDWGVTRQTVLNCRRAYPHLVPAAAKVKRHRKRNQELVANRQITLDNPPEGVEFIMLKVKKPNVESGTK